MELYEYGPLEYGDSINKKLYNEGLKLIKGMNKSELLSYDYLDFFELFYGQDEKFNIFKYINPKFKVDHDVNLNLMQTSSDFYYLHKSLKKDKVFFLKCIEKKFSANILLKYSHQEIKKDIPLIIHALHGTDGMEVFNEIDKSLWKNQDFIILILSTCNNIWSDHGILEILIDKINIELKKDPEFMLRAIQSSNYSIESLDRLDKGLRKNKKFILSLLKSLESHPHTSKWLQENIKLQAINKNLLKDEEIKKQINRLKNEIWPMYH